MTTINVEGVIDGDFDPMMRTFSSVDDVVPSWEAVDDGVTPTNPEGDVFVTVEGAIVRDGVSFASSEDEAYVGVKGAHTYDPVSQGV